MTRKNTLTVPATEFKAKCLELMDRVRASGLQITVTKHGKPVAKVVPMTADQSPLFGSLPVTIIGDIVAPIDERWDAER
jgi:prevent-host-death family protein